MKTQTQANDINGKARITQKVHFDFPYPTIIRVGDICIAQAEGDTPEISEANAKEIVKRVNMYEELVEELKEQLEYLKERGKIAVELKCNNVFNEVAVRIDSIRKLLKEAEKK